MAAKQLRNCITLVLISSVLLPVLASGLVRKRNVRIRKLVNSKGPYLGLITVYEPEENAFFATNAFKQDSEFPYVDLSGRRFRIGTIQGKRVIYVRCGVGMVNAAAATQQMLDLFYIKGLIHFGISGNTNSSLSIGDVSIPKQFANTGLWDWLKPNATVPSNDVATLEFCNYNMPQEGKNSLGRVRYRPEEFYSEAGEANTAQRPVWFHVTEKWLQHASTLQGMKLNQCVNASLCLESEPKVVIGLKGCTSNTFLDNASYRDFLFQHFRVSSADMESSAVVMTSLSNGYPVIVIRGLSDLAGAQEGRNSISLYGSLAASNVAQVVVQFIKSLPTKSYLGLSYRLRSNGEAVPQHTGAIDRADITF